MKVYRGRRHADGCHVTVHDDATDGVSRELMPRLDLRCHSHTGCEWGYGGSGPAQLALALCADATGSDERALRVYQQVKTHWVAGIGTDFWEATLDDVMVQIEAVERAQVVERAQITEEFP